MSKVPEPLRQHINTAYPDHCCLVGTVSADGDPQISPKGSVVVLDGDTMAFWERAMRGAWENLQANPRVTIWYRQPALRESVLPASGAARFWGSAEIVAEGDLREKVWATMCQAERDRDPEKKGVAVIVRLDRAEHLNAKPLAG